MKRFSIQAILFFTAFGVVTLGHALHAQDSLGGAAQQSDPVAAASAAATQTEAAAAEQAAVDPRLDDIRKVSEAFVAGFNAAKPEEIAALFLDDGELVDEDGVLYLGHEEIKGLLALFFERFPGVTIQDETDSIRFIGPIAIHEGTRIIIDPDGNENAIRYTAVLSKSDSGWKIASVRDFPDETPPTPGEMLQPLEWLVGEWINEGADARVSINYQWSEDGNFLLGEFTIISEGQPVGKSSQRIGWDPISGKPKSWMFDSDGGFAEANWTPTEDGWILRSSAVLPDGQTGSARLKITLTDENRITLAGTDRFVGDAVEDDYELMIVRKPPTAEK